MFLRPTLAALAVMLVILPPVPAKGSSGGNAAAPTGCRAGERNSGRILDVKAEYEPESGTWYTRLVGWVRFCDPHAQDHRYRDAFGAIRHESDGWVIVMDGPQYPQEQFVRDFSGARTRVWPGQRLVCLKEGQRLLDCWGIRPLQDMRPLVSGPVRPLPPYPAVKTYWMARCGTCW